MLDLFRDNIVVHTHIKKTAGTTLSRGLKKGLGRTRVLDTRGKRSKSPDELTPDERKRIYVLAGHFLYDGKYVKYFDRNPIYIASVRPPLERYRSAYDYVRIRPNHPDHARIKDKTLEETVAELVEADNQRVNVMARALSGSRRLDPISLFEHVEDNYLIVTPHYRVNDTINALVPLLGGKLPRRELHKNRSRERTPEDFGKMTKWFEEANRLDTDLVQFVEDSYDRWLEQLPERLDRMKHKASA